MEESYMKGFCEACRDMVEYSVESVNKKKEIKGKSYSYHAQMAFCNECGEEMIVSEVRDYNLRALDHAFRKAEDLIEVKDIERILEKYEIGKRPLSLLLGWGEVTLSRYLSGDLPSKLYSDELKKILENEAYYREIIVRNKDRISDIAFTKSLAAINNISEKSRMISSKLESAVKYLLVKSADITPLALQKLLYFSQGFYKAFTDDFLFIEDCEAWAHGPVFRHVYLKYKTFGYNPIEEKEIFLDDISLNEVEKDLLDQVVLHFGCFSGRILEHMTHSEMPWRCARGGLMDGDSSSQLIEKADIETYFKSVKNKYEMLTFGDIKDYSKDLISKIYLP